MAALDAKGLAIMSEQYLQYLQSAREVATLAGAMIREKLGQSIHVDKKGRINLVTEVDMASEKLIRDYLAKYYPDHYILGEEGGETACSCAHPSSKDTGAQGSAPTVALHSGKKFRWIVDPLDGTTNFAQGYPFFCVSIALEINDEVVVGVVHDPNHNETFYACRGQGAFLNDYRISVTNHSNLEEALLVTGFPYDISSSPDIHLGLFRDLVVKARGIRRDGSAALDLCYVACGRFDAFWELGLSPWDMAAGSLIVREAGGQMSDFAGATHNLVFRDMLASNSHLHHPMLEVIKPYLPALRQSPYWVDLNRAPLVG